MANKRKNRKTCGILPLRLWIGKKLFGAVGPHGVRVSLSRMIKGPCATPELEALKYVAEHTSIPVPKVFNAHYYDDCLYIEMEYVRGMSLEAAWYRGHLSQDQKKYIITEVAGYIRQLRKLEPPREGIVASASFNEALDHRVGSYTFGPFTNHQGFHSYLRANVPIEDCNEVIGPEVTECHSRRYRSCFTHADIAPRNIMVDNGKVSAIVDWQFGGWYPEYWEYTKAHYGQIDRPEWYDGLENAMEKYDDELKAEQTLWRRLDEPQLLWRGREHLIPNLGLA
ncbi:hypothetical protein N7522_001945 [Penicillium canescens]|uniref:Aminoglycoside phosphotransferase domain-containing protein n=1 Tax=Penicillium canescens TaxID=5083 RepID=A0AAD6I953_PENCN|nr:uncharacterized protein N7446_010326 [Penicillium canescens]KAJ6018481.1 hypothetical protein N7522_001945 [Penicillium canescens]KAJ6035565.1 hypothetical protein N7460_009740 [Penicillium canescens]KAJ6037688.1 hypothetical protein N7444_010393 [Penicillium canescens]KAJ6054314.1 hypothetical protein N7446_010326 [Penicillium canescens]